MECKILILKCINYKWNKLKKYLKVINISYTDLNTQKIDLYQKFFIFFLYLFLIINTTF